MKFFSFFLFLTLHTLPSLTPRPCSESLMCLMALRYIFLPRKNCHKPRWGMWLIFFFFADSCLCIPEESIKGVNQGGLRRRQNVVDWLCFCSGSPHGCAKWVKPFVIDWWLMITDALIFIFIFFCYDVWFLQAMQLRLSAEKKSSPTRCLTWRCSWKIRHTVGVFSSIHNGFSLLPTVISKSCADVFMWRIT